jgi:uncharacterized membrane-anchored protein YitT (DUF2179 family)
VNNQSAIQVKVKEYIIITIGVLLVVVGVYFFKFPNNFSIGGVTGIAIVLSSLFDNSISSGTIVIIINMLLLIVGYLFLGKSFGNKTAYGSILMSAALRILEVAVPMDRPMTSEPMLELAFAVVLPSVGAAMLFNIGASSGGTDIIAMLLKKYTNIDDIGRSLFYTDLLLTLAAFLVFDIQTGLLSLLGLFLKSAVLDTVIENINLHKYLTIICEDPKPISDYILNKLHRSATICDAKGAFSDKERKVILTVMNRGQAVQLRRFIKEIEPDAFILITNTSEIIGRGFRA